MPLFRRNFDHGKQVAVRRGSLSQGYTTVKELGRGADGIAYVVRAKDSGEECVAKESNSLTGEAGQKFRAEFEKMKTLQHPNILRVYELLEAPDPASGHAKDRAFIIMDLARGGDLCGYLTKVIRSGGLTEGWVAAVLRQALAGVAYLHEEGVAHNDLKPDNILMMEPFTPDAPGKVPHVVITDFGRATTGADGEFVHGDLRYQAPEVWRDAVDDASGERAVEMELAKRFKADMWSMGAVLFELASGGKLAFLYRPCELEDFMADGAAMGRLKGALFGPEPVRVGAHCADASPEVESLLLQLLDKDWERRPSALRALEHPWFSIQGKAISKEVSGQLLFHANKGRAQAMFLSAMAMKLQSGCYDFYADCFRQIDDDHSGQISLDEFRAAFAKGTLKGAFTGSRSLEDLVGMFRIADVDESGYINFIEFLAVTFDWSTLDHDALKRRLQRFFADLDKDGDGYLDVGELDEAFQGVVDTGDLADLFRHIDSDGDGRVTLDELNAFLFKAATEAEFVRSMDEIKKMNSPMAILRGCFLGLSKCCPSS
mmetsp:Transcript_80375/g.227659  ORF Transcript_80375/g.227659 Transcript_80375/m.227659 type:complete len:544 (+) Transcript_80375:47-1678(+)